jgi:hypothetical protein
MSPQVPSSLPGMGRRGTKTGFLNGKSQELSRCLSHLHRSSSVARSSPRRTELRERLEQTGDTDQSQSRGTDAGQELFTVHLLSKQLIEELGLTHNYLIPPAHTYNAYVYGKDSSYIRQWGGRHD